MDGYCTNPMFLLVDNSDSPSIVEQLQQGCDSGCYTLLAVIPSYMKCLMLYACHCQLASCSKGISYYASYSCSYVLMFPVSFLSVTPTFLLFSLCLSLSTGALQSLLFRLFSH